LVISLSKDAVLQERLIENISKLAITNADEIVAKEVLKSIS